MPQGRVALILMLMLLTVGFAVPAAAQEGSGVVEVSSGWAGFVDDVTLNHFTIGGGVRWHLSPRISVGPEVVYMVGPGDDRDLFVTGNIVVDFLADRRVAPYFVAGGGMMVGWNRIGTGTFTATEGAFTVGGGVRIAATDRMFIAAEARLGWELHTRLTGVVGYRF